MFFERWTSSNQTHFIFLFSKLVVSKAVVSVFCVKLGNLDQRMSCGNKELEFSVLLLLRYPRVVVLQLMHGTLVSG